MSSASQSEPGPIPDQAGAVHGSCVAFGHAGILILGPSGSGKSALALELMAMGAKLVADDRVILAPGDGGAEARAPRPIKGMIEARGIGILAANPGSAAIVRLVVDMGPTETERLPPQRTIDLIGFETELVHNIGRSYFAAALRQYLVGGRRV